MIEQRLRMIEDRVGKSADGHILARYVCKCGREHITARSRVRNGYARSCGCLGPESSSKRATTHGMHNSPEYRSWGAMITRCRNTNSKDYPRYGGAGIAVCDEWAASFEAFLAHVGPRPAGMTLDRIDGSRGYEPGNVRWATLVMQARNKKSTVVVRTPHGVMYLVDYAKRLGITRGAAHLRLKRGKLEGASYV